MTPVDTLLTNLRACAGPARFVDFDDYGLTETDARQALHRLERDKLIRRVPDTCRYEPTERARYHVCRPAWPTGGTVAEQLMVERRQKVRSRSEAEKPNFYFE